MKVLVLGGCGSQGRAALYDLSRNVSVDHVTCADIQPELIDSFDFIDKAKIQTVRIDANDPNALASKMDEKFDVVLDFLPPQCIRTVAEAAIKSGVNLVNTNYAYDILDLDQAAKEKGIAIIPECGLDPGIDLIIYNYSLKYFDNEKDLSVMVNKVEGVREGKQQILTCSLIIERDLMTGLMAMSMGVAYPACIAAEMIVKGEITRKGVLSPATDVPCDLFIDQLKKRDIKINKTIEKSI